jgi:hypothetical protein
MPGAYTAYIKSIYEKTGKTPEDFWRLAGEKGFIKEGKITARHAEMLGWLKKEIGLGHVHANMVILYLRLRTDDPNLTPAMKEWAYNTGYQKRK